MRGEAIHHPGHSTNRGASAIDDPAFGHEPLAVSLSLSCWMGNEPVYVKNRAISLAHQSFGNRGCASRKLLKACCLAIISLPEMAMTAVCVRACTYAYCEGGDA
jgi:hypothetical protein